MTLNEIENEYGFKYSAIYNQLEQDGMLDVGEYGPEWFSTVFPRLKENPTLLLYSYDLNYSAPMQSVKRFKNWTILMIIGKLSPNSGLSHLLKVVRVIFTAFP